MKYTILILILLPLSLFAQNPGEVVEANLLFHQSDKKENRDYKIVKLLNQKNEKFKLKLLGAGSSNKEVELKTPDAQSLISEMNDLAWDFEYKHKKLKGPCPSFAELEVKATKTVICVKEKTKAAKVLGLMGRLNFFLK